MLSSEQKNKNERSEFLRGLRALSLSRPRDLKFQSAEIHSRSRDNISSWIWFVRTSGRSHPVLIIKSGIARQLSE